MAMQGCFMLMPMASSRSIRLTLSGGEAVGGKGGDADGGGGGGGGGFGGAVFNRGSVTIVNSTLTNNRALRR
jgi:hypothetical protein